METAKLYVLINPTTNETFYVGATTKTLSSRLHDHYCAMYEARSGGRNLNMRLAYLSNLMPTKALIKLVGEYPLSEIDNKETELILELRLSNKNLTNGKTGGIGGNTMEFATDKAKFEMRKKISEANKGVAKPDGFAEHLSTIRKGKGNPLAKPIIYGNVVIVENKEIVKEFEYYFEINEFMKQKNTASNIAKVFKKGKHLAKSCGYVFILKSHVEQYINDSKDIVWHYAKA